MTDLIIKFYKKRPDTTSVRLVKYNYPHIRSLLFNFSVLKQLFLYTINKGTSSLFFRRYSLYLFKLLCTQNFIRVFSFTFFVNASNFVGIFNKVFVKLIFNKLTTINFVSFDFYFISTTLTGFPSKKAYKLSNTI